MSPVALLRLPPRLHRVLLAQGRPHHRRGPRGRHRGRLRGLSARAAPPQSAEASENDPQHRTAKSGGRLYEEAPRTAHLLVLPLASLLQRRGPPEHE